MSSIFNVSSSIKSNAINSCSVGIADSLIDEGVIDDSDFNSVSSLISKEMDEIMGGSKKKRGSSC